MTWISMKKKLFVVFRKLQKATVSFVMFVCLSARLTAWSNQAVTGRIFMQFYIHVFFENLFRKLKFYEALTSITGTVHEDQHTFMIMPRLIGGRVAQSVQRLTTGLKGPGSKPGGDEIFRPFRPALEPTQPPVKWAPGLSRGLSVAGACC